MTSVPEISEMISFIRKNLSMPIVMTGLMGAGKSSVGTVLAEMLSINFIDSDHVIEQLEGMSIPAIFDEKGENYFRDLERKAIREIALQVTPCVLGTGGGAFMHPETRELILSRTISIFLKCDLDLLTKRVGDGVGRPLFKDKQPQDVLETLIISRYPTYEKAAIMIDSCDETVEETAKKVIESLYKYLQAA